MRVVSGDRPGLSQARTTARLLASLSIAVLLSGCFGGGKPKPQPLAPLTPKMTSPQAWTQHIGRVSFPLAVAVNGTTVTLASDDGNVMALNAESGSELWRAKAGGDIAAGVGSDGRFAAVVTREGELVVLEQGVVKWHKTMPSRVTTAPLVAGERVFVLGIDRSVQAFDVLDGRKLWTMQRPGGDPLTLSQAGVLLAVKDTLVVGQGPRLSGVDPLSGQVRWDVPVGSPRGANEIERLADLVGPATRLGNTVCVRSFQAAVGCVDADRGLSIWSKNIGGTDAVTADAGFLIAADASDRISAWTSKGDAAWTTDRLLYRSLSSPLVVGNAVVFDDAEGTLHFLARDSGEPLLRLPTDGGPAAAQPVRVGDVMLVVTRKGGLYALRPS